MGFKARIDAPSLVLYSHLHITDSDWPGQGLVPILYLGMVRLPLDEGAAGKRVYGMSIFNT